MVIPLSDIQSANNITNLLKGDECPLRWRVRLCKGLSFSPVQFHIRRVEKEYR